MELKKRKDFTLKEKTSGVCFFYTVSICKKEPTTGMCTAGIFL